jgi:hypothetical protein
VRSRLITLALGLTLLAACKAAPVAPAKATKPAKPEAIGASATAVTPGAVVKLQAPPGAVTLSGKVEIDANYLVAQGGGNVISNDGSSLVAQGGGNLVDGKVEVGGHIVAQGAGNIVAQGAGNVISHTSSAIVASGGGNVVASGAGNLAAPTTGSYHLQADAAPALGTILPAVGLLVWVRDLYTGRPVPIGQDADGQPIYAVYTNAEGKYEIYLDPALQNQVLVVTEVPFSKDPRLTYTLVRQPDEKVSRTTDEDSAAVTRYLRETARAKFRSALVLADRSAGGGVPTAEQTDALIALVFEKTNSSPQAAALMSGLLRRVFVAVSENKVVQGLAAERLRFPKDSAEYRIRSERLAAIFADMAELIGDRLVSKVKDLDKVLVNFDYAGKLDAARIAAANDPQRPAMKYMEDVLKRMRERSTTLLKQDASFFANKLYLQKANMFYERLHPDEAGKPHYTIVKASDVADFLVQEYFPLLSHGSYGCETGCYDAEATGAVPLPTDCGLPALCIPDQGLGPLTNKQITGLSTNVFLDLGLGADDYLLLVAGCSTLGETVSVQLLNQMEGFECLLRNYGSPDLNCE